VPGRFLGQRTFARLALGVCIIGDKMLCCSPTVLYPSFAGLANSIGLPTLNSTTQPFTDVMVVLNPPSSSKVSRNNEVSSKLMCERFRVDRR
jgi:hypothetical protein